MGGWGRHAGSQATCYAELHFGWLTFLDQPQKNILQSGWLLRYFGDAELPSRRAFEGSYTRSPKLAWQSEADRLQTRTHLAEIIGENFRKFLTRRKIRKVLAAMADDD